MTEKTFKEFKSIYSEIAALEVPAEFAAKTTLQLMEMAQRETEKRTPLDLIQNKEEQLRCLILYMI